MVHGKIWGFLWRLHEKSEKVHMMVFEATLIFCV